MTKHVQVRNLDSGLHRKLKQRVAGSGTTISDYVRGLIEHDLSKPTLAELGAILSKLPSAVLEPMPEAIIRDDRDSR